MVTRIENRSLVGYLVNYTKSKFTLDNTIYTYPMNYTTIPENSEKERCIIFIGSYLVGRVSNKQPLYAPVIKIYKAS